MLPGIDPYRNDDDDDDNDDDDENENDDGNKDDFYGGLSSLFFSLSQSLLLSFYLSIYLYLFRLSGMFLLITRDSSGSVNCASDVAKDRKKNKNGYW